ncbi:hypothetical protein [Paracoccus tegillarcae]|uniref:Uncharacterized protein n=1 Tax=Paracoccus tegillarcae TaxID=1529068 RepID=A0A2K9ESG3_9RHOB|nr:hypothetical protein [Paracoccus tegillarcae]AUH34655.1 hypothetical protein CUV01_15840 [Paracoccus tegillarcae]
MRIVVEHETIRRGLILKTTYHAVCCTIHLSHEEQHVIRERNLQKTKLLDRRPATARVDDRDEKFVLLVRDIMDGQTDRFLLSNPASAKLYELELLAALSDLKGWIGLNTDTGSRSVTEL